MDWILKCQKCSKYSYFKQKIFKLNKFDILIVSGSLYIKSEIDLLHNQ